MEGNSFLVQNKKMNTAFFPSSVKDRLDIAALSSVEDGHQEKDGHQFIIFGRRPTPVYYRRSKTDTKTKTKRLGDSVDTLDHICYFLRTTDVYKFRVLALGERWRTIRASLWFVCNAIPILNSGLRTLECTVVVSIDLADFPFLYKIKMKCLCNTRRTCIRDRLNEVICRGEIRNVSCLLRDAKLVRLKVVFQEEGESIECSVSHLERYESSFDLRTFEKLARAPALRDLALSEFVQINETCSECFKSFSKLETLQVRGDITQDAIKISNKSVRELVLCQSHFVLDCPSVQSITLTQVDCDRFASANPSYIEKVVRMRMHPNCAKFVNACMDTRQAVTKQFYKENANKIFTMKEYVGASTSITVLELSKHINRAMKLPNLRHLTVEVVKSVDELLRSISPCKKLRRLDVGTSESLRIEERHVERLNRLKEFRAPNCDLKKGIKLCVPTLSLKSVSELNEGVRILCVDKFKGNSFCALKCDSIEQITVRCGTMAKDVHEFATFPNLVVFCLNNDPTSVRGFDTIQHFGFTVNMRIV